MNRRTFLSGSAQLLAVAQVAARMFAADLMPENNQHRPLSFSNDWIDATLVTYIHELPIPEAIVVNLSTKALYYRAAEDRGKIAPWKSAILRDCTLEDGDGAALLHVRQRTNLGGVALAWEWYGQRNPQFPRTTPLYISPQDDLGVAHLNPGSFGSEMTFTSLSPLPYRLKLNLWYTPEETDCGIHTGHQFLEVHTQILGTGHMQKFREKAAGTLYEDVLMPPGYTHDPFFVVGKDRTFTYPWHRYYADTDCIWMAVELHPL
jgi:hypothetical protein